MEETTTGIEFWFQFLTTNLMKELFNVRILGWQRVATPNTCAISHSFQPLPELAARVGGISPKKTPPIGECVLGTTGAERIGRC